MADNPSRPLPSRKPISWNDLRAFLAVSLHGSMNRAAVALGESQPTVGRRMRRLEHETGLILFLRGPNSLLLTPAAKALAEELAGMAVADEIIDRVIAMHGPKDGDPVRITSTNSLAIFLSAHMTRLRKAASPRDVVLIPTRHFVDVVGGEADIALRMRRVAPEPGLLSRKVGMVAAAIYSLAGHPDLPMITPPESRMFSGYRELALRESETRGKGPQIDELHLRLQAVRAGVGAGILPCWIGDADPSLIRLSERPDQFILEDMFLIRSERSRHNPVVQAVAQALGELFRKHSRHLSGARPLEEGA